MLFSIMETPVYTPTKNEWGFMFLYIFPKFIMWFKKIGHLDGQEELPYKYLNLQLFNC